MKKPAFALILMLLTSLACSTLIHSSNSQATEAPAGGTPPAGTEAPLEKTLLFEDDFSSPSTGWDMVNLDYKITDYTRKGFRIWVGQAQLDVWSNLNSNFDGDVLVQVDATRIGGPDANDFGVTCRHTEKIDSTGKRTYSYYAFLISSDGKAAIVKSVKGKVTFLNKDEGMKPVEAVKTGRAKNTLLASCIGNVLTLNVNGEKVIRQKDSSIPGGGDVGLIAGTFDEGGVDILFENFKVFSP